MIETFNVFKSKKFRDELISLVKIEDPYCYEFDFKEELKRAAQYCFWAKCEYEVEVSDWTKNEKGQKVDIFQQLMMNWDNFYQYVEDKFIYWFFYN